MEPREHPDYPRVIKLIDEFFERMISIEEDHEAQIALDDFCFTAIPVVREGEEHEIVSETVVTLHSTKKGHAQVGMLELAHAKAKKEFINGLDEDDYDDDEEDEDDE